MHIKFFEESEQAVIVSHSEHVFLEEDLQLLLFFLDLLLELELFDLELELLLPLPLPLPPSIASRFSTTGSSSLPPSSSSSF